MPGWSEDSSPSPWVGLGGWSPLPAPTAKSYSYEECWSAGAECCMSCRGPSTPPRPLPQTLVTLEVALGLLAPTVEPGTPHGFHIDQRPLPEQGPWAGQLSLEGLGGAWVKPEGSQSPQGQTPRPQGRAWQGSAPGHLGGTPGAGAALRRERSGLPAVGLLPAGEREEEEGEEERGGGGEGKEEEDEEAGSQSHPLKDVGAWGIWARGERRTAGTRGDRRVSLAAAPGLELRV